MLTFDDNLEIEDISRMVSLFLIIFAFIELGNAAVVQLSASEKQEFVNSHNEWRIKAGATAMLKVAWKDDLAKMAESFASECKFDHSSKDKRKNVAGFSYIGENIHVGTAKPTPKGIVDKWGSEITDYNLADNSCKPKKMCGHYTQVTWSSSSTIGCAIVQCDGGIEGFKPGYITYCEYGPGGNIQGSRPFETGAVGSKCQEQFKVAKDSSGLCAPKARRVSRAANEEGQDEETTVAPTDDTTLASEVTEPEPESPSHDQESETTDEPPSEFTTVPTAIPEEHSEAPAEISTEAPAEIPTEAPRETTTEESVVTDEASVEPDAVPGELSTEPPEEIPTTVPVVPTEEPEEFSTVDPTEAPIEPVQTEAAPAEDEPTDTTPTEDDTTEPAPTEPAQTEDDPTEDNTTDPAPAEDDTTEPAPAEDDTTEPAPAEDDTTEPAPTEPAQTEDDPTERTSTEPAPTEPASTEPAATDASSAELPMDTTEVPTELPTDSESVPSTQGSTETPETRTDEPSSAATTAATDLPTQLPIETSTQFQTEASSPVPTQAPTQAPTKAQPETSTRPSSQAQTTTWPKQTTTSRRPTTKPYRPITTTRPQPPCKDKLIVCRLPFSKRSCWMPGFSAICPLTCGECSP